MQYLQHSDAELIHAYVHGQERALEVLINRYKDKVYTSVYMLVKDKYLAEDIFQDLFIKIIDSLKSGRYNDEGKFTGIKSQGEVSKKKFILIEIFLQFIQTLPVAISQELNGVVNILFIINFLRIIGTF